jgi:hypothetical protein
MHFLLESSMALRISCGISTALFLEDFKKIFQKLLTNKQLSVIINTTREGNTPKKERGKRND